MKILLIIVVGCLFCNSLLWARQHDGVGTSVLSPRTSLSGNSLEMELEKSLDVPADIKTDILVDMLDEVLLRFVAEEEIKCWKEVRQFTYFDTPEDSLMRQGITLRVVTGFSPDDGDGEGLYRYDYKLGEKGTEARREGSYWSNRELSYGSLILPPHKRWK